MDEENSGKSASAALRFRTRFGSVWTDLWLYQLAAFPYLLITCAKLLQFCGCCWERTNPQGAATEAYRIFEYLPAHQQNMESTRKCSLAMWLPTPQFTGRRSHSSRYNRFKYTGSRIQREKRCKGNCSLKPCTQCYRNSLTLTMILMQRKSACCSRILVVIELVVSGT